MPNRAWPRTKKPAQGRLLAKLWWAVQGELLGHADIKMTLRHAHLCPGTLAAAVAKLG